MSKENNECQRRLVSLTKFQEEFLKGYRSYLSVPPTSVGRREYMIFPNFNQENTSEYNITFGYQNICFQGKITFNLTIIFYFRIMSWSFHYVVPT